MRPLIVTPTYQEAENIDGFLRRLRAAVPDVDILVVDDNSPDGTADVAQRAADELGHIDVLQRPRKIGLGDAYRAGFAVGIARGYDTLVQIDADHSHDPVALPAMFAEVDRGADAVIGSRYVPGGSIPHWPWHRKALSRWGNRYAAFVLALPVHDTTSGYRVYTVDVLKAVDYETTRAKGYGFQMELAYRVHQFGGKIVEYPISFTDRVRGQSKLTWRVAAEELALVTWWGARDRLPQRHSHA